MRVGEEIEQVRKEKGWSVITMCNTLDVTEAEYYKVVKGQYKLSTYQLICFVCATGCPLYSLDKKFRS